MLGLQQVCLPAVVEVEQAAVVMVVAVEEEGAARWICVKLY